jgi:hypothetical protein
MEDPVCRVQTWSPMNFHPQNSLVPFNFCLAHQGCSGLPWKVATKAQLRASPQYVETTIEGRFIQT